ncbi:TonB-dependent receptor [Hydrogenophaga sp.]|uniref:TonB-dependent receptor family protein n=1 Tax=Hydrogenophaga sp. TaxID=1904254 RepID=UPI002636439A|nr:TonB-dependent receptor [Hydrogenophaga sp.]MCW5655418.1 TonB-dependent receptor [Hydrogenophaga sp.]
MKPKHSSRVALCAAVLAPCALAQTPPPPPPMEAAPQLPTVVIETSRVTDQARQELETEQALTPGGVSLVDGESLRQRNVTSLGDMLRYVPGLWAASGSTGDSSFLSSRGSNLDATNYDGNGIKLLQDGLPVTAADGNNHNRQVDPLSASHAVVARGANALTYGASTLGGAIDFVTPTARDGAPNELLLNAGSHGQWQSRVTVGGSSGNLDGLISAETRQADGYRLHHKQQRTGLYANGGLQLSNAVQTRFYATYVDNQQQLPGVLTRQQWLDDPRQAEAAAVAGNYRYNVETWRLANKTVWDIDADSKLTVGLSYEDQQLYHPIVYAPPFFSLLIDTQQRTLGSTVRYQRRMGAHDLLLGLNWASTTVKGGNYSYVPGGAQTLSTAVNNRADSLELFVMDRWQFAPNWTAVYGAQALTTSREVSSANLKGDYHSVNPRAGVIRQLTPTTQLFANVSRIYEAPTLYELEDETPGGPRGTLLDAMRGTVFEIGTRGTQDLGQRNHWRWDVALYHTRLRSEILSRDDPTAPGTSLSINVDGTVHAGLEALVGGSFAFGESREHRIEPMVNLTVNHFRFRNDGTYGNNVLPAAPKVALRGEVLYRHASGFFAGPTIDIVGSRWADFSNTYKVNGYTLWGLRAGWTGKDWEVFAEARNLANKNHVALFSVRDVAAANAAILTPGEPRSLYVGARMKF